MSLKAKALAVLLGVAMAVCPAIGAVPVYAEGTTETGVTTDTAVFLDPPTDLHWVDSEDLVFSFSPVEGATSYVVFYKFNNLEFPGINGNYTGCF